MRASKRTAIAVMVGCAVLLAIWSLLRPAQRSKDIQIDQTSDVSLPARELAILNSDTLRPPIAIKLAQAADRQNTTPEEIEEQVVFAYSMLDSLHSDVWLGYAFDVARFGDPHEAAEAIIDLLQNQENRTAENAEFLEGWSYYRIARIQDVDYRNRLRVLMPLGLTGTERAEEFLLNAYTNPSDVAANKKHKQLFQELLDSGHGPIATPVEIDLLTWKYALTGLMLLDEQKCSAMIEDEFEQLKPIATRLASDDSSPRTVEEYVQNRKFGVLLDVLVTRDVIRERGTLTANYLSDFDAKLRDFNQYARRYWDFPDGSGPENWHVIVD